MKPIVNELKTVYGDEIEFVVYDIDLVESRDAMVKYNFRIQPHFILVDANGEVVEEWLGYQSANVFEEAFAEYVN